MQALYGRNGESPVAVLAASSPSDCFYYAYMSAKIALERMTPVILLTDGFLGNGSEPWKIPSMKDMPDIKINKAKDSSNFKSYKRNSDLVREWAVPGMEGFEHRIGGLEKDENGGVSHVPENHELMCRLRAEKVARIVDMVPNLETYGCSQGNYSL